MGRVGGKTAIVTGAGRGMGAASARLLAQEGARVLVTDIDAAAATALAAELTGAGLVAEAFALDVTSPAGWQAAAERAEALWDRIDILVNNAGLPGGPEGWEDATPELVARLIDINFNGQFLGIRTVAPRMAAGGSIVNMASIAGLIAFPRLNPGYGAAKGAIRSMSKAAAVDFAARGVRVNAICPGLIHTPYRDHITRDPARLAAVLPRIPLARAGAPEEVARVVLFLASDDSSYITGTELVVDGGYTAL